MARPPGSSPTFAVPVSPTIVRLNHLLDPCHLTVFFCCPQLSSEQFPTPSNIYQDVTPSSEQPDGSHLVPHVGCSHNHNSLYHAPVIPNVNAQATGLSTFSYSHMVAQPPPIYPDTFSWSSFDIYTNGMYDVPESQTPSPFTTNNISDQDIIDPPHSHPYLCSSPNPSPLSQSNTLTLANIMSSSLNFHHDISSFLPPSSSPIFTNTSHLPINASTPSQSPTSYFEDSDFPSSYDLP